MPALEILDLSKNRLTKFPDVPGKLSQLKVLSLTNNKIYTLPAYLVSFNSLKVFKVDSNPIEWPVSRVAVADHLPSTTSSEVVR
jgi:Leucine-rich repeat (LRR) protein